MEVIRGGSELPRPLASSVVTIGNFDGVHRAHQELLRKVVNAARRTNTLAVAVTFDPHPAEIIAPERAPRLLTPLDLKISLIEKCGIDLMWVIPFTQEVARISAPEFVQSFLVRNLHANEVFVGANFRFGHGRQGNVDFLSRLGNENGFRGERVSSSGIRAHLSAGNVELANRLLGRPYSLEAAITSGDGVGRKLTVPTLNLASSAQQLPADGVYVTRTGLGGESWDSVANVGEKPTFGRHPRTVETYLLNFKGEVTADRMRIEFLHRLREEIKFPDAETLKAQIMKDVGRARKYFRLRGRLIRASENVAL
jgi:riboflavin kinase / FMN adenylyltransferase